tara:strand:+ start:384 stop:833 length:450 start_codon:yes stop_codon:yes gene_type:complete
MIEVLQECDPSFKNPKFEIVKEIVELILKDKNVNNAHLSFIFCSDDLLSKLKKEYFGVDQLTDVITFDLSEDAEKFLEAEIYVNLKRANINAKKYDQTFNDEVKRLIIHGLLHLLGFDDKTFDEKLEMEKLENQYLKTFDSLLYPELNV